MAYEVFKSEKTGKYHFRLKAKNGEIILASEAYEQKAGAMKGIESVAKNAADDTKFERRQNKNGEDYFVLKAGNGEVIGKSETYKSTAGMENGIQSVMNNAGGEVKDMTV